MLGNTPEYIEANAQILEISQMIDANPIFDELKPYTSSDIVNLSLSILRKLIQIHDESCRDIPESQRLIQDISESSYEFIKFSEDCIDEQRRKNEDLKDVLLAIETLDDKEDFIHEILLKQWRKSNV